ncbi:phage portal protein [Chishuiella sp.]|uniref:phage portal protein n=1 Tax=Chishuiella sp. TaxID=1969467 RepID=UPI0028A888A8|nr:phage portal protein [Chishuiella sp.]
MKELYELIGIPEADGLNELINALKQGKDKTKIIAEAKKQLDPNMHDIMIPHLRDKRNKKRGEKAKDKELVSIALALQKWIVKKEKAMIFGNTPLLKANIDQNSKISKDVLKAIERILHDNKESSLNRKIAECVGSYTEGGEIWYLRKREEKHSSYGFDTDIDVKVMQLTPKNGENLYTFTDDFNDLKAFSRNYSKKENGKEVNYFEVYTANKTYKFKQDNSEWTLLENYPQDQILKKIPIAFAEQEHTSWYDVQKLIERYEQLISDHGEVNDRNAYPILLIEGGLVDFLERGPGGGIKLENGSDAKYLSWDNAPESIKLEIENIVKNIQLISQTPNFSFDEVKRMSALSGTALKMLFLDAHLKVMEKREIYDEYLQRRINIIKRILATLNPAWKTEIDNMIIEPEIVPFMVENEKEQVEIALLKNGNKPLESHEKSVKDWQGQDTEDYEQIKKEEKESANVGYFSAEEVE